PHVDAAPGYTGEFYQAPLVGWAGTVNEIRGRITIKESMQGAPGRTSSMYSIASLAENVAQLREATDALHGLGDKAMVDFTGHLSSDSQVIAEHFEFFK